MQEFFTKRAAEEGLKIPLFKPDGSPSEHWLLILGIDSDTFKKAEFESKQQLVTISKLDGEERFTAMRMLERKCVASLIIGWSFDQPCTPENVLAFLIEAPQIESMVNKLAAQRSLFFKKGSLPSKSGQNSKRTSTKSRKAPKSV